MKSRMLLLSIPYFDLTPPRRKELCAYIHGLTPKESPRGKRWRRAAKLPPWGLGLDCPDYFMYCLERILDPNNSDTLVIHCDGMDYQEIITGGMWPNGPYPEDSPTRTYKYFEDVGMLPVSVRDLLLNFSRKDYEAKTAPAVPHFVNPPEIKDIREVLAVDPMKEPEEPPELFVVTYEHRHGTDCGVNKNMTDAQMMVCAFLLDWVDEVGSIGIQAKILNHISNQRWSEARALYEDRVEESFDVTRVTLNTDKPEDVAAKAAAQLKQLQEDNPDTDFGDVLGEKEETP